MGAGARIASAQAVEGGCGGCACEWSVYQCLAQAWVWFGLGAQERCREGADECVVSLCDEWVGGLCLSGARPRRV